eukprot:365710-Chlamydomonas_euryale.AAC.1
MTSRRSVRHTKSSNGSAPEVYNLSSTCAQQRYEGKGERIGAPDLGSHGRELSAGQWLLPVQVWGRNKTQSIAAQ